MNDPQVTVAIPHHFGWRHLQTLLPSLAQLDPHGPVAKILVVDNASPDESQTFLKDRHPWVECLELPENRFFAGALNEAARRTCTPWLAFLNNDMRVEPGWLREAMDAADRAKVVCVASRINDWEGRETQFCGGAINLEGKGFQWTERDADPAAERFLHFPCGGAMLIRRDVFLDLGGFEEAFEMIYEDVDLGWRLNLSGYPVLYAPRSVVYHRGHASLERVDYFRKAVYFERNSLGVLVKNLESAHLDRLLPFLSQRSLERVRALSAGSLDGLATLRGIEAFWSNLAYWRRQRERVQERRTIPDKCVPGLFSPYLTKPWGYTAPHTERISACRPSLDEIVQMLFPAWDSYPDTRARANAVLSPA